MDKNSCASSILQTWPISGSYVSRLILMNFILRSGSCLISFYSLLSIRLQDAKSLNIHWQTSSRIRQWTSARKMVARESGIVIWSSRPLNLLKNFSAMAQNILSYLSSPTPTSDSPTPYWIAKLHIWPQLAQMAL
jgi:hypothetical protein